jgi:hypothetical protein
MFDDWLSILASIVGVIAFIAFIVYLNSADKLFKKKKK